jgi:cell division protein FtsI/penicillin-binding protein 2
VAALAIVVAGVLTIGLFVGFGAEPSAEPTVRAFLLDWQQQSYQAAAELTTGDATAVVASLKAELTDLDGTAMFLSMGRVTQQGQTAEAYFKATVDLAEGGHQWTYQGHFALQAVAGGWKVHWSPSVVEPDLGTGDRLAVATTYSPRAQVLDSSGKSLLTSATAYLVGVTPDKLADPGRTASEFASVAGLDPGQVLGEIRASPSRRFMELLTLDQATFSKLLPRLRSVPGLTARTVNERLSGSIADGVVGRVGTENSAALRAEGTAYLPGETIGESGVEQVYQNTLAGTPATDVMVVNTSGQTVKTLQEWAGTAGTPVKTTINGTIQQAAVRALNSQSSSSGEIVAVQASTGDLLAVAQHSASGQVLPAGGALNARLQPGMAFTIISAAALLGNGFSASKQVPCEGSVVVGGQTFTTPRTSGSPQPFATDFANGCGTAFANLSTLLSSPQLSAAERGFGIGATWVLPLQAFSGSAEARTDEAALAADAIGEGGVRMSPLGMALVAAEVDSGTGHAPAILASDPPATRSSPLSASALSELRDLMRDAVRSGTARAANVSGTPVYGQAGLTKTGAHTWLSWFVGYRGDMAFSVLETSSSPQQAAAAMTAAFVNATR